MDENKYLPMSIVYLDSIANQLAFKSYEFNTIKIAYIENNESNDDDLPGIFKGILFTGCNKDGSESRIDVIPCMEYCDGGIGGLFATKRRALEKEIICSYMDFIKNSSKNYIENLHNRHVEFIMEY